MAALPRINNKTDCVRARACVDYGKTADPGRRSRTSLKLSLKRRALDFISFPANAFDQVVLSLAHPRHCARVTKTNFVAENPLTDRFRGPSRFAAAGPADVQRIHRARGIGL